MDACSSFFRDRLAGLRVFPLAFTFAIAGCASFQAHPEPVLNTAEVVSSANFNIADVLYAFESPSSAHRNGLDPQGYRNMVIGTLMMAADSRYLEFRRRLAAESRGSSLLLDIGVLGLSGGASLASERTANALAAGAAGLTGTRAAVSRDVYFDRTIPAMIGIMDAERTKLRTAIMSNLRRPANEYPLAIALSDVASYEAAASLDGAIELLTREAAERSEQAREAYAEEVQNYTGPPEPGVADIKREIRTQLRTFERNGDRNALLAVANRLGIQGISEETSTTQIRFMIEDAMANARTLEAAREFSEKVATPGEGPQ